jgi:DNA-binding transcriptional MerR regulator
VARQQSSPTDQQLALEIPDKVFFRIGEVARLTGVKAYVLRYWETEFAGLRPKKSQSGQRRYRKPDVEAVLQIKRLLWDEGFTIKGARAHLRAGGDVGARSAVEAPSVPAASHVQVALDTRNKDLATVRAALVTMRSQVTAFLADFSQ